MKQIIWGTDLHYNFPSREYLDALHQNTRERMQYKKPNSDELEAETLAVIITGDTSEAHLLEVHLKLIREQLGLPVFFVCGNHDYWKKKMSTTRALISKMTDESDVKWLGAIPYGKINDTTAVVGHDGWYDAYHGDWKNSNFFMNDWMHIPEFHGKTREQIVDFCRSLAKVAAEHVQAGFRKAVEGGFKNIIVATHIPPFRDASVYNGRKSDETAVCWYTSQLMGDALYEVAAENPDVDVTVLAGHTHNGVSINVLPNMVVHVGHAEYYEPRFRFVGLKE